VQKGKYAEAIAALKRAAEVSRGSTLGTLGYCYGVSGQRSEAERALIKLHELSKRQYISPDDYALIYTGLGEQDQALAWLEKAYQERSGRLVFLKVEPKFESLRSDNRFTDLLRRIGFER
jgi:Flp pilus assembly protein TadD